MNSKEGAGMEGMEMREDVEQGKRMKLGAWRKETGCRIHRERVWDTQRGCGIHRERVCNKNGCRKREKYRGEEYM